jgi:transposase
MKLITGTQIILLNKKAKIMKFLRAEGYTDTQIAEIFNVNKSTVNRVIVAAEKYKKSVKKLLSD